ncbi:uncharacterized protein N7483_009843 [Penicillium malachiteum]|uniref:uncharacterized protein n=1 Tax=Penicillium malachiteum TaxID=1324776 RepID=UPI0025485197|nr:uncharacterized protein N7483_009843 [Penicillium malachiteum]KAJ5721909.1 hypothetical protein N7483_009843 [Penicillium malachiteum]
MDDWKKSLTDLKDAKESINVDLRVIGNHTLSKIDSTISELQGKADKIIRTLGDISQDLSITKLPCAKFAGFNAFDPSARVPSAKCLENTRIEILKDIEIWGMESDERCISWLNGMAGTGKSTLTDSLPELRLYLKEAIDKDRTIGEQTPQNQWERLILEPLSELDKSLMLPLPVVIIIDALDECRNHDQHGIMGLFSQAKIFNMIRLRTLIVSRPEKPIVKGFQKLPDHIYREWKLDSDAQTPQTRRDLDTEWLGEEAKRKLAKRTGRLFIYAATVCRFLEGNFPEERLGILLSTESTDDSPTADLDEIYSMALRQKTTESAEKATLIALFQKIVGTIILLNEKLSPLSLSMLLDTPLRKVRILLDMLRSVLVVPDDDTAGIYQFLTTHLLHRIEVLGLIGKIFDGIGSIIMLEGLIQSVQDSKLREFVYDAKRFMFHVRYVIEEAPLQLYCSGLLFTPHNSIARRLFEHKIPPWFEKLPTMEEKWSPIEQKLQVPNYPWFTTISSDGKMVASGSMDDEQIYIYDTVTGKQISKFTTNKPIMALKFQESDTKLALVNDVGEIKLLDISTGEEELIFQFPPPDCHDYPKPVAYADLQI